MVTAAHVTEAEFQASVIRFAELQRWAVYYTYDSRRSPPGFPDLVLCRDRLVFAELKTLRGRVRAQQLEWLARLRGAGAECYLWRPSQWSEIRQVLA
jgi:VRR-NUC domain